MRCAPRQVPERAGRGYQRRGGVPPGAVHSARGSPGPTGADALERCGSARARDAWWVRTSAAVTAARATTAARAAAGSVCAGDADDASRWALWSSRLDAVQAGQLTEDRHRGAVVAAGHRHPSRRAAEPPPSPRLRPQPAGRAATGRTPRRPRRLRATAAGRRHRSCTCTGRRRCRCTAAGVGAAVLPAASVPGRDDAPGWAHRGARAGSAPGRSPAGSCGQVHAGQRGQRHERLDDVGHVHRRRRQRRRDACSPPGWPRPPPGRPAGRSGRCR